MRADIPAVATTRPPLTANVTSPPRTQSPPAPSCGPAGRAAAGRYDGLEHGVLAVRVLAGRQEWVRVAGHGHGAALGGRSENLRVRRGLRVVPFTVGGRRS